MRLLQVPVAHEDDGEVASRDALRAIPEGKGVGRFAPVLGSGMVSRVWV